jgi:uncharacterized protein YjbI with pentapeptide repeats
MMERDASEEPVRRGDVWATWWGWFVLAVAFVVLLIVLVVLAWMGRIETGFGVYIPDPAIQPTPTRAKTLWDWMDLLLVPLVLAVGAAFFAWLTNKRQRETAEQRLREQRRIEHDRVRAAALQTYLDCMTELLQAGLRTSEPDDETRHIARVQTLATLRQLDGERKGWLLRFLYESNLIGKHPVLVLRGADLDGADLRGADLSGANLGGASLAQAHLQGTNLSWAMLHGARLAGAVLHGAHLVLADLREADLRGAKLQGANLSWAKLRGARLDDATQLDAKWRIVWSIVNHGGVERDLQGIDAVGADLHATDLGRADLRGANLAMALLTMARLQGANLGGAELHGADLRGANLHGARVTREQLAVAESFQGAILPDGAVYEGGGLAAA